jgi:molecular chaperone HtpG
MVAPVPFDYQKFRFIEDIEKFLNESGIPKPHEYCLYINNEEVKKGYETPLKIEGGKTVVILDVRCKVITDPDGNALGWYWFCVSAFDGFLPKKCWQRGLRLRKANIQIGDADCLTNHPKRGLALWKDDRGNTYFIGEIHALDDDLIPNSRRDYFNQDVACRRFEKALSVEFADFWDLCRCASNIRSATEKVKAAKDARQAFEKKDRCGLFYSKAERDSEIKKLELVRNRAIAAEKTILKIQEKVSDGLCAGEGDQSSPLATIVQFYAPQGEVPAVPEALFLQPQPKKRFVKDKFNKGEKRILDIAFKVLNERLPPGEANPIRDEILKRAAR